MSESQQEPEICHVIGAKRYWQGGRIFLAFPDFSICRVGIVCSLIIYFCYILFAHLFGRSPNRVFEIACFQD